MTKENTQSLALAVETSGRAGSVAIGAGGEIVDEITFSGAMRHSAELFTATEKLLKQINAKIQDVKHIYIAAGPGSFTGVRIAVTMAKILAFCTKASIIAVNTTEAIVTNASVAIAEEDFPIEPVTKNIINNLWLQYFYNSNFKLFAKVQYIKDKNHYSNRVSQYKGFTAEIGIELLLSGHLGL